MLGKIEWLATVLIPGLGIGLLTLLPFLERSPARYYGKPMLPLTVMGLIVLDIVLLTLIADIPTVSETGSKVSGLLQAIAGLVIPGLAILALFVMAWRMKTDQPQRMGWTAVIAGLLMIAFTGAVLATAPARADSEVEVAGTLSRPDPGRAGPVLHPMCGVSRR